MSTILKNYIMAKKRKPVEPPVSAAPIVDVPAAPDAPAPRWFWLCMLTLVAVTIGIYLQTGSHDFVNLDDLDYIPNNPPVRGGLTMSGIRWAFVTIDHYYWQPLTWISHMIDCQLFGLNAGGHHLVSMLLHALNSALMGWMMFLLTGKPGRSAFAAALFCVHPLRVESVAWAAERKDLLSGLFWILTITAYLWYCKAQSTRRYLVLFAAAAAAAMSKPSVVTLPFVLLLLDYWPLQRLKSPALLVPRIVEKIPLFAISVVLSVITFIGQSAVGAAVSLQSMPVYYRFHNALNSYGGYLWKTIWPTNLSIFYPLHKIDSLDLWLTGLVMLAITALCLRYARVHGHGITGWLWFVGALVPMIGFAQVGVQSMADRFTYIPSMGLFLALSGMIAEACSRLRVPSKAAAGAACVVCAVLAVASYRYTTYWKDSYTLFEHSVAVTEDNDFLHLNLANLYIENDRLEDSARHFEEAIRIEPKIAGARLRAAQGYIRAGKPEKAVPHLRVVKELSPQELGVRLALAEALWRSGKLEEARAEADELIKLSPNNIEAHALRMMMK
ncbi:MAG: tetratricopeptide repeat protein [Acidobacteria bacterium]|nr:tetratricopeptide repeat protein [Acidobacteriota bacterium]